jgi:hypothetical protein
MSLIIYENHGTYWKPIGGSRVKPSGLNQDGRPAVGSWECPRCGQDITNKGGHLFYGAPCRDCRWFLRDEYGDDTRYDKRVDPPAPLPVFEIVHVDAEVGPVQFPLAVLGAELHDLYIGDWAA